MSTSRPPTAAARRTRFGAMTAVLLAAVTLSLIVANVLASRYAKRFDVTATAEHQLSPRSTSLLSRLDGDYEIVVAAPLRDTKIVDPRALEPLRDVLDQFRHAPGRASIKTTLIDTGSASGVQAYDDLLKRLAARDAEKVRDVSTKVEAALGQAEQYAGDMEALSPRLQAVEAAILEESPGSATNRSYFQQRAAELRTSAQGLRDATISARSVLAAPTGALPVPDVDRAMDPVRRILQQVEEGLNDIAENSRRFAAAQGAPDAAKAPAQAAAVAAAELRDRVAITRDAMDRVAKIDLLRVARTLQATTAALVIGPPQAGLTAIDLQQLLPPPATLDVTGGARADLGRSAEEMIATALASLAQPVKPIVMFVHGQPAQGLLQSPDFAALRDRLALRGIDAAEWAAAVEADPPPLTRADPTGKRPVVYVILSNDVSQSLPKKGQSGPERAAKLGHALSDLIGAGKSVLLSLDPSTLPTFGETDPIAAAIAPFGLLADTGRPLLKERFTAEGRHVDAVQVVTAKNGDHPIAHAIRGLPTVLEWPIAIRTGPSSGNAAAPAGTTVSPLIVIDDSAVWGESQWLSYWQVKLADHDLVPNKPSKDSQRDDGAGPWPVVVAAERASAGTDAPQRLVVVGSNTWFMDRIAQNRAMIDGRPVLTSPGNAELFEASIYWLAHQDEMIAQSPTARAVPLIRPLGGGTLLALRWAAIAGLPGLVLLVGLIWRLARG